jgi:hypothetical protein
MISTDNIDLWKKYVDGDTWKCPEKSPTKAHYWQEVKKDNEETTFVCKYCVEKRKMANTWSGALLSMSKKLNKHLAISQDSY